MRKPAAPRDIPPPLELECLKVLWQLGEGSVKDVRSSLAESRDLAYTTVMSLMDRLVKKGSASRRKSGRMFLYAPLLPRDHARRLAVQELVDTFFGGSREDLRMFLEGQPARAVAAQPQTEELDTALL
jgi:predicted transcriptional regulator